MNEDNNERAIAILEESSALLDAVLTSLRLYVEDLKVICELNIKARPRSNYSSIAIRISNVKRFDFYYDDQNPFYLIDRYKLFERESGEIYLSLDPYDEKPEESDHDCGVIVGRRISLEAG